MSIRAFLYSLPLIISMAIFILLWRGLNLHPNEIASPLINQPAPFFQLPDLYRRKEIVNNRNLLGHVSLLNVWSTACSACMEEHDFLLMLSKQQSIVFIGLDYKDDTHAAKLFLKEHGNPYQNIAVDESGQTAINWGVYGTPETFIVDKRGFIRYKQIGAITPEIWEKTLKPIVQVLADEKI